ncbi:MAG: HEAT repeat domain-containing protein [Desulfuromonadaceae bacterium]
MSTMITPPNIISTQKPETGALVSLITELYIARRNRSTYPKDHPVITDSLAKVLLVYEKLLREHDEIILGVTNEALIVDGVALEKSNLVVKNFSRLLFERGIGAVLFRSGLTRGELHNFITLLILKRETIQKYGGIEQIWAKAGITAMTIRPVRYDLFKATNQDTIDEISHDDLSVSPVLFGLLQRLGATIGSPQNRIVKETGDNEISNKMKTILREHASEEFVPDSYQKKLNRIIASDHLPNRNMEEVSSLLTTMESCAIEGSIGQILMNLIREDVESPEERDMLLQNVTDMFGFFLQTGDYGQLYVMINQLKDGTFPIEIQNRLREEYGRREFIEEILDGLTIWGKPRYSGIKALIMMIGGPFVESMLDRLSVEKKMSIRRLYIDCLIEMGPETREPILNRLYDDTRWYFLRNLLIILSSQIDPSITNRIRPFLRSEDPRLRHEVLNILQQGGYSQREYEKESAVVRTLGKISRLAGETLRTISGKNS